MVSGWVNDTSGALFLQSPCAPIGNHNLLIIGEKLGYGLGGNLGNKQLPNQMVDRVVF